VSSPATVSSCQRECESYRWEVRGRYNVAVGVCASSRVTGQVQAAGGGREL
jgi:hypothetical protein